MLRMCHGEGDFPVDLTGIVLNKRGSTSAEEARVVYYCITGTRSAPCRLLPGDPCTLVMALAARMPDKKQAADFRLQQHNTGPLHIQHIPTAHCLVMLMVC
ncbi:hypothetical protein [Massilia scottii]|uniref:hypothetical protein n=1 Tax=Massilia scottii TaxID=3057166 RepID=UPI002796715C|nr:hypothetical protein [Massilia sp. CCM 9029]MDQ1833902.1 hypothetical protein [Massilia sp. CCM 9029]